MLQDIAPNLFDNSYHFERFPHPGDIVVAFDKKGVWKVPCGGFYRYSDLGNIPHSAFIHLFSIGNISIYRCECDMLRALRPEASVISIAQLRTLRPQWLAYAVVTAYHLDCWYKNHRFCGSCATPLQRSTAERALFCPQCNLTIYPQISPAVIVAICCGERLLLTRYANRPIKHWALVAGYSEIGETLEQTIHREVAEEVGLKVKNLRYFHSQPWPFSQSLLVGFFADVDGDEVITLNDGELEEARWFMREELPELPHTLTLTNTLIRAFSERRER